MLNATILPPHWLAIQTLIWCVFHCKTARAESGECILDLRTGCLFGLSQLAAQPHGLHINKDATMVWVDSNVGGDGDQTRNFSTDHHGWHTDVYEYKNCAA